VLQDRPEHGISKPSYMQAVLAGLQEYRAAAAAATAQQEAASSSRLSPDILVKFLLSIDRRNDTAAALDTVSHQQHSCMVNSLSTAYEQVSNTCKWSGPAAASAPVGRNTSMPALETQSHVTACSISASTWCQSSRSSSWCNYSPAAADLHASTHLVTCSLSMCLLTTGAARPAVT
jgi:hypothetical protein